MLVVDALCLYEIVTEGRLAESVRTAKLRSDRLAAPELIDVEVMGLIRRDTRVGALHDSRSEIAVAELHDWAGVRFAHRAFSDRVWERSANVRTWDAYDVALAEALDAPLVTLDRRLARATGPICRFIVPDARVDEMT